MRLPVPSSAFTDYSLSACRRRSNALETFAEPREFVENTRYARDRQRILSAFTPQNVDTPILDVVFGFARLSHCFTLQSCHGHFVYPAQPDPDNLAPLPAEDVGAVRFRIAYVALCIEHSAEGACLRGALERITTIDPEYVQFGSPGWFWERHPNSYALQVEPERFMLKDDAVIEHREALHVQWVRDRFFERLRALVEASQQERGAS